MRGEVLPADFSLAAPASLWLALAFNPREGRRLTA